MSIIVLKDEIHWNFQLFFTELIHEFTMYSSVLSFTDPLLSTRS